MRILASVVIATSLCLVKAAGAGDNYVVDGISVNLPRASGFCPLLRDHEVDGHHYTQQDSLQAGHNMVIAISIPCKDVGAFRNGTLISEFGMWLLNAPKNKITRIPDNYSRDQLLSELAKSMQSLDTAKLATDATKNLRRHQIDLKLKRFGLVDQDTNGIYMGILTNNKSDDGKTHEIAGITGITAFRKRVFSFNLYRPFETKNTYDTLLSQVKQVTANAVGFNSVAERDRSLPKAMEPPQASVAAATGSFNWTSIAEKGTAGAMVGAVLGGLAAVSAGLATALRRLLAKKKDLS